jgi:nucleotide-binding universal stress UspA family protein
MKTILAALDFSDAMPRVVHEAERLARAVNGHVVLLHVARVPEAMPHYATQMAHLAVAKSAIAAAAGRQLERIKESLWQRGVATQSLRLIGDPKRDIAEQARKLAADYIVMGSHGHTALHDLVVGSTTSAVLKRSNRVVVVVPAFKKKKESAAGRKRDGRNLRSGTRGFGGSKSAVMKTILTAIDFSPVTKRVVAEAVGLAQATRARVVLLNVTTPNSLVRDYAGLEAVIEGADPTGRKGDARRSVLAIHGDSLQIIGEPVEVILEQAARCCADYIVMGSHGHTALFEMLVGGTAEGVLRGARCPVMLIPPITRKRGRAVARTFRRKDPVAWLEGVGRRKVRPVRWGSKRRRTPSIA